MSNKKYLSHLQKNNYIELKTLEYYLWDKLQAQNIFNIRHMLTPRGFEVYIKYYLKSIWYKMTNFIWWNKPDWWIDLKWTYKNFEVFVQCKKYIKNSDFKWKVWVWELRNFYWWVVSEFNGNISNKNVFMLFVTTGSYSHTAKKFAKNSNIRIIDYQDLAKQSETYNLYLFEKMYKENSKRWNFTNFLSKKFLSTPSPIVQYSFDDLQENDIFIYLKNIRSHIIDDILNINEVQTSTNIFKDGILHQIAYRRITNYTWLHNFHQKYGNKVNELDKSYLVNYAGEIIKWLQILKNNT